ncbi:MAG: hypothetical protein R3B13_24740 [Polyangiaceae bacterium]
MARMPPDPEAERTPLPGGGASKSERRVVLAWREWLGALATDAEAALAAAMAYKALDDEARDEWLGALEQDAPRLGVPRIAVYAPLLAVESDIQRRRRILDAIGPDDERAVPRVAPRGLLGHRANGESVAAVVWPLYLDFVQVLACGFHVERGFSWVRHDPILQDTAAPRGGDSVLGVQLDAVPLKSLVDDLAVAVLSHQRSGKVLPDALRLFADLFSPMLALGT